MGGERHLGFAFDFAAVASPFSSVAPLFFVVKVFEPVDDCHDTKTKGWRGTAVPVWPLPSGLAQSGGGRGH